MDRKVRIIAHYLPQFHPTPENDLYWGKGFTEWTNVGKAKPLFHGHYQPRVPADLGYYDLRCPWIREAQAEMARDAGIEGFMYWHYWFGNGKMTLQRPFEEVLESGKPDFPFCLGWANHDWTNHSWNAAAAHQKLGYIFKQEYPGEDDYVAHFKYVLPAFKDKRYITVDEKPLFMIYSPLQFPDCEKFVKIWRELATENGLKGIFFIARAYGWRETNQKVLDMGFDAVNSNGQFEAECATKGKLYNLILTKIVNRIGHGIQKYDYEKVMRHFFTDEDKIEYVIPTIMPNWDRSPRSGSRGIIYHNSTPEKFKAHVQEALSLIKNKPIEHRLLILKSWNEWAEGNYMEPDIRYGHGYLNALKNAIDEM